MCGMDEGARRPGEEMHVHLWHLALRPSETMHAQSPASTPTEQQGLHYYWHRHQKWMAHESMGHFGGDWSLSSVDGAGWCWTVLRGDRTSADPPPAPSSRHQHLPTIHQQFTTSFHRLVLVGGRGLAVWRGGRKRAALADGSSAPW